MPPELDGYERVHTVRASELCDEVHDFKDWVEEQVDSSDDIEDGAAAVGCATVSILGYGAGPGGSLAILSVCAGPIVACAAQDAIESNVPCGDPKIYIYIPESEVVANTTQAAIMMVDCEEAISDDIEQLADDMQQTAEEYGEDIYDYTVSTGDEVADALGDAAASAEEVADDLISSGLSLLP
ncbi:hypothetical protein [Halosimplex halobium]|uniref:hypothetical protein n=1 Tax=Halosimplex halobium TaxID=3396618 RepID=UPI003F5564E1